MATGSRRNKSLCNTRRNLMTTSGTFIFNTGASCFEWLQVRSAVLARNASICFWKRLDNTRWNSLRKNLFNNTKWTRMLFVFGGNVASAWAIFGTNNVQGHHCQHLLPAFIFLHQDDAYCWCHRPAPKHGLVLGLGSCCSVYAKKNRILLHTCLHISRWLQSHNAHGSNTCILCHDWLNSFARNPWITARSE